MLFAHNNFIMPEFDFFQDDCQLNIDKLLHSKWNLPTTERKLIIQKVIIEIINPSA